MLTRPGGTRPKRRKASMEASRTPLSDDALLALRYWRGDEVNFDGWEQPGEVEAYDSGALGCGSDGRYYLTPAGFDALDCAGL